MNEFRHNVTSGVDIINGCTLSSVQVLYYPSFLGRPCSSQSWWTWIVKWWNECLISHNPLIIKPHSIPTVSPEVIWNRLLYGSGHQPATNFEPNPCITTKVAPPNLWHTHVVMTSLATLNIYMNSETHYSHISRTLGYAATNRLYICTTQWWIQRGFHGFHGTPLLKGCLRNYYAQRTCVNSIISCIKNSMRAWPMCTCNIYYRR